MGNDLLSARLSVHVPRDTVCGVQEPEARDVQQGIRSTLSRHPCDVTWLRQVDLNVLVLVVAVWHPASIAAQPRSGRRMRRIAGGGGADHVVADLSVPQTHFLQAH